MRLSPVLLLVLPLFTVKCLPSSEVATPDFKATTQISIQKDKPKRPPPPPPSHVPEECEKAPEFKPDQPQFWLRIGAVLVLLLIAAMMSGLTIGLISLDVNNLQILKRSGTPQQQKYAAIVEPIRRNGHLLLCTLLLINMLATEALPIVLDELLGGGIVAILVATSLIVLFGEIIPQAICARHALAIGAYSAWLVRGLILLTFPISWPISKLLGWLIGEHEGVVYRRSELKELVALHGPKQLGELMDDEVTIIASVLDLKSKRVEQIMTPLDDVFMLDLDTVLDHAAFRLIDAAGYSRIPVYVHGDRTSIIGLILVKSLITVDPAKKLRIRDVKDLILFGVQYFDAKANLFSILNEFQEGKGHLAVIAENLTMKEVSLESRLKIVGILTLEDVVEELIGEEILDETDVYVDVRTKQQVNRAKNFKSPLTSPHPDDHFTRKVRRRGNGLVRRPVTFETHFAGKKSKWTGMSGWKTHHKETEEVPAVSIVKEENDDAAETDELLPKQ